VGAVADIPSASVFSEHVGEPFVLVPEGGEPFEAVLSSCEKTPYGSEDDWQERVPFSLVFHHEGAEGYWPQHTFSVRHPEAGSFDLFLVPIGPDQRGMQYQAVIS
jgi:uncharacterized protein DUF6916